MFSALLALALAVAPPVDTAHVVLVATTDVHGRTTGWDYETNRPFGGGLARAATVVDSLRARYPGQVVVVDAGDLIQGEPFAAYFARVAPRDPNPIVEAMNLIGYDAATAGNHEFNWGLDVWRRAVAGAAFRYVSGNIYVLPADTLAFAPYTVVRRGPVRIGIAGFTTPGVMVWDRDNVRGKVRVAPVGAASGPVLERLTRDADLRVVLIHSGMDAPSSYDTTGVGPENVATDLARGPAKPDIVVVGHSHREMRDSVVAGVHFVQPKNWAQSVTVTHVDLVPSGRGWRPVRITSDLVPLKDEPPAPRVARALAQDHQAVLAWVTQPLARATAPMPAAFARAEATPLIAWIHAVQRARTGAQLSAASAFDIRGGFPAGEIRLADVARIYPYENTLRAIRLSGAQLKAYLEQSARYYRLDAQGRAAINDSIPGYNFDMVGGATYALDLTRPVGDRVRGLAVQGRPVQPTDSFTMALNSYRQAGGGGYDMLQGAPVVYDRGENIRDLLADDLRARGTLDPAAFAERSWRIVPDSLAAEVHALFAAPVPAPAAAGGAAVGGFPVTRRDTSIVLRVLGINDLHGALLPRTYTWSGGRPVGGMAAVKGMMDSLAADCGCPVLRLDAGDQMQGTLVSNAEYGRATVAAMNLLGIQAAALGNHDFDWTVDTLRARMAEARYPWLAANIVDSATGRRPAWLRPWAEVTTGGPTGGVRVAVIGYVTPETKRIVKVPNLAGLRFDSGAPAIRDVLDSARARRPDVTIVVAHAGALCDSTGAAACSGEILDLARDLQPLGVDLVVAGHTHRLVNTRVAGLPVVQARANGQAIDVVDIVRGPAGRELRPRVVSVWADGVRGDSAMIALLEPYRARVDSLMARPVVALKFPLGRKGDQYPLGNLVADARRNAMRADVGLANNGGIRANLPAGPVSYGQLYEVQPFGNRLVKITLTGAELRQVLEHVVEEGKPAGHVAGLVVRYDSSAAATGRRVRSVRFTDGRALRDRARYTLATDDFLGNGGSGYTMLVGRPVERSAVLDVDGLVTYLRRLPRPVAPPEDPRLIPVTR